MFFVLSNPSRMSGNRRIAVFEVAVVELILHIIMTLTIAIAMMKMRNLKYDKKIGKLHDSLHIEMYKDVIKEVEYQVIFGKNNIVTISNLVKYLGCRGLYVSFHMLPEYTAVNETNH